MPDSRRCDHRGLARPAAPPPAQARCQHHRHSNLPVVSRPAIPSRSAQVSRKISQTNHSPALYARGHWRTSTSTAASTQAYASPP